MVKIKLNALALGYSLAIISAGMMLFMGLFGSSYGYMGGGMMMQWQILVGFSFFRVIFGVIGAGIVGFMWGWLIASLYNKFA
jgi:hypothetical protein